MNNVFTVWAGGVEINSHYLSKAEAESLLAEMQSHGYDDAQYYDGRRRRLFLWIIIKRK